MVSVEYVLNNIGVSYECRCGCVIKVIDVKKSDGGCIKVEYKIISPCNPYLRHDDTTYYSSPRGFMEDVRECLDGPKSESSVDIWE